ncbi:antitoxin AF2212-like protein [Treponema endosymbiont of Eucomonympha sp.]|uniref:antitoxin AF2212-like protein n=1 Tax=Treponema endosymbiont of Eucomonympha sp. TaxID=1580831 RepID=UPI0007511E09|nr:antitoxin AF2212-like protein [Treponema endosymbiont of Eucomonympha sp.]
MLVIVQGFFEGGKFIPSEPVKIPEYKKVILTILDEDTEKTVKMAAWKECLRLLDESIGEEVPDFPRANLHRKVEI